ncbi:hypothetical protein CPLU01_02854 [Colletotrichum plurivorum]|uniref:Uncharacterized protein n=1 Tax=Colletotrichum plurivorum TaxID=2175906 RepID=A0A8H6KUC9_9PEZI|nr:hypothetical protein CPLU01_02854 [Colletotrichum plurivorum]
MLPQSLGLLGPSPTFANLLQLYGHAVGLEVRDGLLRGHGAVRAVALPPEWAEYPTRTIDPGISQLSVQNSACPYLADTQVPSCGRVLGGWSVLDTGDKAKMAAESGGKQRSATQNDRVRIAYVYFSNLLLCWQGRTGRRGMAWHGIGMAGQGKVRQVVVTVAADLTTVDWTSYSVHYLAICGRGVAGTVADMTDRILSRVTSTIAR